MSTPNWERRRLISWGSNLRLDLNNPNVSLGGKDIYNFYGITTEEENVSIVGLQENGTYRVWNDRTVEIIAGQKSDGGGVDVLIQGKNGDVCINADKNGRVRIRAKDIILQADEDIDIQAGRNLNLTSGSGRLLLKGNTLEETGLKGNLLPDELQWAYRVFENTGLPGGAFGKLIPGFGGITDLAGKILNAPNEFAASIQGAVSNAVDSVTSGGKVRQAASSVLEFDD